MPLAIGTRLGNYEILSALGAGAMGEVYRARDLKLNRDIALKILPATFTTDADRLARFRREAHVLATLNHPHIAAIYALDEADGIHFLILELVDGETLDARIGRRPLSTEEALDVASQVADAIDAAHQQGIIHRDLKPANIALTRQSAVKVLDFGLAKPLVAEDRITDASSVAATMTAPALTTRTGSVLGTPAYMSPEQVQGQPAAKQTDIWAFGCIVFEMLAGCRPFGGDTVADAIAQVLTGSPDWTRLPPATPSTVSRLLRRCLARDPRQRLRDIGDARLMLDDAIRERSDTSASPTTTRSTASTRRASAIGMAIGFVLAGVLAVATWRIFTPRVSPMEPSVRFAIVPPAEQPFVPTGYGRDLALSPDGTRLVYRSTAGRLFVRGMDTLAVAAIDSGEGADSPFFSPDGKWVAFFTGVTGQLKKVAVGGGSPISLCSYQGVSRGGTWGPDNTIVFATNDPATGLMQVPAAGGPPAVLTTPDRTRGETDHVFPSFVPGAPALVFAITMTGSSTGQIAALDLKTGHRTKLSDGAGVAEITRSGHLVAGINGAVQSTSVTVPSFELSTDSPTVVRPVMMAASGAAQFTVSSAGTLAYVSGGAITDTRVLTWVDRRGREEFLDAPPRRYQYPRLSPDGRRVALDIRDEANDIWIWDLMERVLTRLTIAPELDQYPVWTPDNRRVIFASTRQGTPNLFWQSADHTGATERLTTSSNNQYPQSIAPDGSRLVFRENKSGGESDLQALLLTPAEGKSGARVERLVGTGHIDDNGEVSPDGRWLAYQSNESGRNEIYVRPFPRVGAGLWPISTSGGTKPLWARDGSELFYLDGDSALTAVPIRTTPSFVGGAPVKLFNGDYVTASAGRTFDVAPDGQRFLMIKQSSPGKDSSSRADIVVVLHWMPPTKP